MTSEDDEEEAEFEASLRLDLPINDEAPAAVEESSSKDGITLPNIRMQRRYHPGASVELLAKDAASAVLQPHQTFSHQPSTLLCYEKQRQTLPPRNTARAVRQAVDDKLLAHFTFCVVRSGAHR